MSLFVDVLTDVQPDPIAKAVVPVGEFLPDQAALNNPGSLEALNVFPLLDGSYGPMCQFEPEANGAVPEAVHGGISVSLPNDVTQIYAGGAGGIYTRLGEGNFTQVLATSVSQDNSWQFIRFKTLMVSLHQDAFPMESVVGGTTTPTVLGGTPPRAACGAMCGDFLVLGNLQDDPDDAHAYAPNRIRWSGIKNIDAPWVTDNTTQADYNDMPPEGGNVIAVSGRTNMTIFQERKISLGRYVNLPSVWDIEVAEDDVGCIARDSIVDVGAYKLFIAQDGFRIWNGTNSERIGDGKVDKYFFNRLQYSRRGRIVGCYDPVSGCVLWAFPTAIDGSLNEIIIYSPRANRFTHSIQTMEYLMASAESTITTDDLTGTTDSDTRYVDDLSFLSGGRPLIAGFSSGHIYSTFTGPNMAATIDTAEFSAPDSKRVFANSARPLVDISQPNISVQPFGRDELIGGPLLTGSVVQQEIDGNCPILAEARYLRFRMSIPAGSIWSHALGIEISRKAGGQF